MRGMPGTGRRDAVRRRLRRVLLVSVGALYVASIPWYREPGAAPRLWLGLPDWVTVALGCYVGVAVLNAIAWALTDVPDGVEPRGDAGRASEPER